ncbi:STAS domain-containing protein [Luteimonas sp. e5]
MPATDARGASVSRDAATLVFHGHLTRPAVAAIWRQAQPLLAGIERFALGALEEIDSAGLALLATLAGKLDGRPLIEGEPPGYAELRTAYRLDPTLAWVTR